MEDKMFDYMIKNAPLWAVLMFFIGWIIIKFGYIERFMNIIELKKNSKRKISVTEIKNIRNHDIFLYLSLCISHEIPQLYKEKSNYGKDEGAVKNIDAFVKSLELKFKVIEKDLTLFIESLPKEQEKSKFTISTFNMISRMVENITNEWKMAGIPDYAIEQFDRWHDGHVSLLYCMLKGGFNYSQSYITEIYKLLSALENILYATMYDAETLLSNITEHYNGNISILLTDDVLSKIKTYKFNKL